MQPLLLTLLIGTAFAMVNAAPAQNKLQSLQALLEGDDDKARMARIWWGSVLKRGLAGLNYAVNGGERDLAEQQEDDSMEKQARAEFFGSLVYAVAPHVLGSILGTAENEMKLAEIEEDDDLDVQNRLQHLQATLEGDDDQARMARIRWGNVLKRGLAGLNYAVNGGEDDDDVAKAQFLSLIKTLPG